MSDTYVTLTEASTFLGVSKATLRNWDKAKKLTANRNPYNSYRMYNIDELLKLKGTFHAQLVSKKERKDSVRNIKQTINKIQSILRDEVADSNIISRFDEISKLLFLEFCCSKDDLQFYGGLELFSSENIEEFADRIQNLYKKIIDTKKIKIPKNFESINLPASVLCKCLEELNKLDFSDSQYDIKGLAYEEILKDTFDKNVNQQFFTPYQIVDFMVSAMRPFLKGIVCDPACGTGGFLIKASGFSSDSKIIGMEIDERLSWTASLNLISHGCSNFEIRCLKDGGSLGKTAADYFGKIDAILTNPPFGSDYSDSNILQNFELGKNKASRRRGILFIEQSYNFLKSGGVVAIIIDRGVLNSKQNFDVQKFIRNHFEIRAVIDLPESAFMPYANVLASILILQKKSENFDSKFDKTFFAKAEKIGRKPNGDDDFIYLPDGSKKLNSDFDEILADWNNYLNGKTDFKSNKCFVSDIQSNNNNETSFRLDYAFHHPIKNESEKLLKNSVYNLLTLADICSEHNESYIPAADSETSSIMFTGLANIESFTGVATQVETASSSIKSAVKRYEKGEILFSKMRPNLRKVALMNFENGGYASSECIVLSVRKNSDGEFIIFPELFSALLRSDFVYGQIMGLVTGIGRPRISGKDLRSVKIPVPPKEIQRQALLVMKNSDETSKKMREKAALLQEEADNIEKLSINNVSKIVSGAAL